MHVYVYIYIFVQHNFLLNLYDVLSLSCIVEENLANLLLYSLHVLCSFQSLSSACIIVRPQKTVRILYNKMEYLIWDHLWLNF